MPINISIKMVYVNNNIRKRNTVYVVKISYSAVSQVMAEQKVKSVVDILRTAHALAEINFMT